MTNDEVKELVGNGWGVCWAKHDFIAGDLFIPARTGMEFITTTQDNRIVLRYCQTSCPYYVFTVQHLLDHMCVFIGEIEDDKKPRESKAILIPDSDLKRTNKLADVE